MTEALPIAIKSTLHSLAQAHEDGGNTLTLAWHNLYIIGQLALVSKQWHELTIYYARMKTTIAVDELFTMVATMHQSLLLQSSKRQLLPPRVMQCCASFSDLEYDNIAAVAREMLNWRTNPYARKSRKPGFPLSVQYDRFAQITSISGDWFSPWCRKSPENSAGTLRLYRSTSEKIISRINPREQPKPRSKATEDLEWTYLEASQLALMESTFWE